MQTWLLNADASKYAAQIPLGSYADMLTVRVPERLIGILMLKQRKREIK